MFKFGLNDLVKDTLTGFKGVVVARSQWQNGCIRYGVQSQKLHEGKLVEEQWLDEQRLELVQAAPEKRVGTKLGGPQRDPRPFSASLR